MGEFRAMVVPSPTFYDGWGSSGESRCRRKRSFPLGPAHTGPDWTCRSIAGGVTSKQQLDRRREDCRAFGVRVPGRGDGSRETTEEGGVGIVAAGARAH